MKGWEGVESRGVKTSNSLCHGQQIVPVHTLVLPNLVVRTDTAGVDHDPPLRVRLGVEEVVALGAEMEVSLGLYRWFASVQTG